ncbi:MAG: DUF1854 domain-containing protein [Planctomycetota bacterium]|jgi:hypothetical protein
MALQGPQTRADSPKEPYYDSWDPSALCLFRDGSGRLRLTIEGDRSFLEVKVVRLFPFSDPERYFALLDARGRDKVIGLVREPEELSEESLEAARQALRRHYFLPTITHIHGMTEEFGAVYCEVETDRGARRFVAKGLRDGIEHLSDGELILPDIDGNRYRVADWRELDAKSRKLLERVV